MTRLQADDHVDGGTYVDVGDHLVWHFHDADAPGTPIVLLHGALGAASVWGAQIAGFLAAGHGVYVPERAGHGHSPDTAASYSFDSVATESVAYLEAAVGRAAHLVGWGDGALVALLVARRRPDLVARLALFGGYVNDAGHAADEFLDRITGRERTTVEFLHADYDDTSPDGPEHLEAVLTKTIEMFAAGPDYAVADFASVQAPTLIVAADCGVARLEHCLALTRALPHGRLAVLPGSHILPAECPDLFNPLVLSFLAADPPGGWVP